MTPNVIPATSTTPTGMTIPGASVDNGLLFNNISDGIGFSNFISIDSILHFLNILWSFYAILAYILSILLLVLYVYAPVQHVTNN